MPLLLVMTVSYGFAGCLSDTTEQSLPLGIAHDRLPALAIGQAIAVGLPGPAMGYQHHPFHGPVTHFGLHLYPAAIRLDNDIVLVRNTILGRCLRAELRPRMRYQLLYGGNIVHLGTVKMNIACTGGEY